MSAHCKIQSQQNVRRIRFIGNLAFDLKDIYYISSVKRITQNNSAL